MRITPYALILCLLPGCVDYTDKLCIPHVDTLCHQGQTYWLDSCDRLENVLEECECGCRADQSGCRTCIECIPECDDKCCGPDGCGGDCPTTCPRGQECNPVTCRCETHCYTNDDCQPNQCCIQGQCTVMTCGTLECGPDPTCGYECGPCPAGYHCENGACKASSQLCPPEQECVDINGEGLLGCIISPNTVPPYNPVDCAVMGYCDGNFSCHCLDDTCSDSVCIENCGACPADLICVELWDGGLWGCLTPDWQLPPNPPYCDQNTPCQGNSICYTDGTNNFCLDNCSSYIGTNCIEGELMCQGTYLFVCQDGYWQEVTDCAWDNLVCTTQGCVPP